MVQMVQQPRKQVLDHAGYTAPTRQHELQIIQIIQIMQIMHIIQIIQVRALSALEGLDRRPVRGVKCCVISESQQSSPRTLIESVQHSSLELYTHAIKTPHA